MTVGVAPRKYRAAHLGASAALPGGTDVLDEKAARVHFYIIKKHATTRPGTLTTTLQKLPGRITSADGRPHARSAVRRTFVVVWRRQQVTLSAAVAAALPPSHHRR